MDNLKRLGVVACATAVGVVFSAGSASAGIIVDTVDGNAFSPRDTTFSNEPTAEQTALVQGFTITNASILNTASLRGFSTGADITIAVTSMIGPGASSEDVLFEQAFSMEADGFGTSIREFNMAGLSLSAGDYFFVIMSEDPTGFEWAKVGRDGSHNINDRGSSTYLSDSDWFSQDYTFQEGDSSQVFVLEIDGIAVPAPGTLAIAGFALTGLSSRRRRGS